MLDPHLVQGSRGVISTVECPLASRSARASTGGAAIGCLMMRRRASPLHRIEHRNAQEKCDSHTTEVHGRTRRAWDMRKPSLQTVRTTAQAARPADSCPSHASHVFLVYQRLNAAMRQLQVFCSFPAAKASGNYYIKHSFDCMSARYPSVSILATY